MVKEKIYKYFSALVLMVCSYTITCAQQVDVDSLLVKTIEDIRSEDYQKAIKKSQKGIALAPDYLDFHLFLGRAYQMTMQKDSARYYLNYVIDKNPKYEASFVYLINLEVEEKDYGTAMEVVGKAIEAHPENEFFWRKKLELYQLQNNDKGEKEYLLELIQLYPNDSELQQRKIILESKDKADRIGLNYSFTVIDRENTGPWHLGSVQYIRERNWGSLIGRINYADRLSGGESVVNGLQYEVESYFFMGKEKLSYSYAGVSFSDDDVFPELRLNYSYYHNFRKGWESEVGVRFTESNDMSMVSVVAGIGKYLGSYWINLRSYFLEQDKKWYPALTFTTRYYMNTRFDYATVIAGYGSSPDERSIQGQIDRRLSLDSFRFGAGYYRQLNAHFMTGIQGIYNNQEYIDGKSQNEFELFMTIQYRF